MRVLTIVNTRAGGSDAGLYDFVRAVGQYGAEVVLRFTTPETTIEEMCLDCRDFDLVVAAGGDGTVSATSYALRDTGVPVMAYPAGTANLLALNLKMPQDAQGLARVAMEGTPVRFDLGEIERPGPDGTILRSGFAVMAGAGYDAQIMESAQPMKASMGAAAYLLAAVSNIAPTAAEFELVIDGEHISTDGIAVLVVNFAKIQFDLSVTHGSVPTDGRFEVAVVRTRNVAGLVPAVVAAMLDVAGEHPDRSPSLDVYSGRHIEVSAYPPLRMQYDGEVMDSLTPFAVSVLPKAATLMVPTNSVYAPSK